MFDIKQEIDQLRKIINTAQDPIFYELDFIVADESSVYFELTKNISFFNFMHFNNLDDISFTVSNNLADHIWRDLTLSELKFKDYFNIINSIFQKVNNFSAIESWYLFSPYNEDFSDYFPSVTGEGFLFKLKNDQYCFFVIMGMD